MASLAVLPIPCFSKVCVLPVHVYAEAVQLPSFDFFTVKDSPWSLYRDSRCSLPFWAFILGRVRTSSGSMPVVALRSSLRICSTSSSVLGVEVSAPDLLKSPLAILASSVSRMSFLSGQEYFPDFLTGRPRFLIWLAEILRSVMIWARSSLDLPL